MPEVCIEFFSLHEKTPRFTHYSSAALIKALKIATQNNYMRFGDVIAKQLIGKMSPAPTIANLYVAIYEAKELLKFLDSFLLRLWRFIDDGLEIWLHDSDPYIDAANWELLKTDR